MKLKLVSGPVAEPVSLETAKDHLRVDHSEDDALIYGYVTAAREWAEDFTRRAFGTQTYDLYFDGWPHFPLALPRAPLQSVTGVFYTDESGDETEWDSSNYLVDTAAEPGRIILKRTAALPAVTLQETNGVRVRFVAGHEDTPWKVQAAILVILGDLYENRENTVIGAGNSLIEVPYGAKALLWPIRVL